MNPAQYLMQYPPQEPLSPLGTAYQARVLALGEGITGHEAAYGADPYQSLTVYPAAAPTGDVLVFLHGGGWTSGYKEWMAFMAPALTARGITFVSAGYRLAPQHVFPVQRDDGADALAWVTEHIASFGGDPRRVFVGGHSAGGHLAALLATTTAWRAPRGLPAQPLAGCLPVSGTYRFGDGSGLSQRPRFLGPMMDGMAELAASPLLQMEPAACPPFLITHGSRDFPHLARQAGEFSAALKNAGVPVQQIVLPDCDHFEASVACGDATGPWPARAAAWMQNPSPTGDVP